MRVASDEGAHLARRVLSERAQHPLDRDAPAPKPPHEHHRAVRAGTQHLVIVHHETAATPPRRLTPQPPASRAYSEQERGEQKEPRGVVQGWPLVSPGWSRRQEGSSQRQQVLAWRRQQQQRGFTRLLAG
eukprot:scaffold16501_cov72-Phaeocystis_antarctica.AAC.9